MRTRDNGIRSPEVERFSPTLLHHLCGLYWTLFQPLYHPIVSRIIKATPARAAVGQPRVTPAMFRLVKTSPVQRQELTTTASKRFHTVQCANGWQSEAQMLKKRRDHSRLRWKELNTRSRPLDVIFPTKLRSQMPLLHVPRNCRQSEV